MAHGGHCGGSHSHYHRHHGRDDGVDMPLPIAILMLVVGFAGLFWLGTIRSDIGGKAPLTGYYETYPYYLLDENNYLSDHDRIVSGLKYLHEKTNVQVVVMVSDGAWSDKKVVDEYHEMFNDEAHMLIVITSAWYESSDYYAIGDLTNSIIDNRAANYLIDTKINDSRDGEKWERVLKEFTDRLLSE